MLLTSLKFPTRPTIAMVAVLGVTVMLAFIHVWYIGKFAVNVPLWDDYDAILSFVADFASRKDFSDQLEFLFVRHNEHRIVLNRVVALAQYYGLGQISFTGMIFFATGMYLLLVVSIVKTFNEMEIKWWLFFPVPFVMFSFGMWEVFLWPMVSVQTVGVIAFAFASFYLLFGAHKLTFKIRFVSSFVLASLSTLTGGNGFFVLLLCLVGLILVKAHAKFIYMWAAAASVVLVFNFYGYAPLPNHPDPIETVQRHPDQLVSHFFLLIGGAFNNNIAFNLPITLFGGFFILAVFLFIILPQAKKVNPVVMLFLGFLLCSACLASISRSGFGAYQALAIRYQIYPCLIFIFLYLALVQLWTAKERLLMLMTSILAVFTCISYFLNLSKYKKDIEEHQYKLLRGVVYYNETNGNHNELAYPLPAAIVPVLAQVDSLNIYELPALRYEAIANDQRQLTIPKETNNLDFAFEVTGKGKLITIERGWAYVLGHDYECETFILLRGGDKTYIFETYQELRPDVTIAKNAGDLTLSGFNTFINSDQIDFGIYQVGLYIRQLNARLEEPFYGVQFTDNFFVKQRDASLVMNFPATTKNALTGADAIHYIDELFVENDSLYLRGWAFLEGISSDFVHHTVIAKSGTAHRAVSLSKQNRADVSAVYKGNYDGSGFIGKTSLAALPSGSYKIELEVSIGDWTRKIETNREIDIE